MTQLPTPPAVVAVCSDHAGYQLKQTIIRRLSNLGYEVRDFGTDSEASCDYPDYAHPCAKAIESGDASFGVAMCGSGNGIAMTLNKHQSIRAAICWTLNWHDWHAPTTMPTCSYFRHASLTSRSHWRCSTHS